MSEAAAAEEDVEAASAAAGSEVAPTVVGHAVVPPLFCAEPSEVLGLAAEQVRRHESELSMESAVDEENEETCLLQDKKPSHTLQQRAETPVLPSCKEGHARVNGNHVARGGSVLRCKKCQREPAPFCPDTGSQPRFCSYCGEALILPSILLEQELSASRIGAAALTRPSARVAQAVKFTTGKAARTVKAMAAVRRLSYRAILYTVIVIAGIAALINVCFPEFLWGSPRSDSDAKIENADRLASSLSVRGFIALLLLLGTSVLLLYRRPGVLCCILDRRIMLSGWRRLSEQISSEDLHSPQIDAHALEAGHVPMHRHSSPKLGSAMRRRSETSDGGDSEGFETCGESDDSSEGEPQYDEHRRIRNGSQSSPSRHSERLLDWMQPCIREAVTAAWSVEQRSKVRQVAAALQRPDASKQEQVMLSVFGNAEVCAWRFLRSSWDPATAGKKLRETALWRAEVLARRPALHNGHVFSELGNVPPASATSGAKKLFAKDRHVFPCVGWDGGLYEAPGSQAQGRWWTTRDGQPLEFWQMKHVDSHEICSRCSQEELTDCYMEYNERRRERVNELRAAGFVVVADGEGIGLSHVRKALRYAWRASLVLDMGERHYPGSVHRFICVNAPTLVHAVYKAVQPVLGEATRNAITITASPPEKVTELVRILEPGTLEVEINPMCVLDFYVVEGHQRSGLGSTLFRTMLAREAVSAERLAYDRPSPKLLGFLRKHFGLAKYMPQSNNFVVFDAYWSPPRHRSSASTSHGNASGSRQGSTPTPPGSRHRPPLATGQPSPSAGSMLLAEGLQEPPPGTRRSIGSSSSSAHAQRHGSGRGTDAATGVAAIGEMPRRVAGATPPPLGRAVGSSSSRTNLRDRREDQSSLPDEVPAAGMPSGGIPAGSASSDGVTGALHGYGHAPASHRRSNSSGTGRSASPLQQVARSMLPSSRHQAMPAAGMRR